VTVSGPFDSLRIAQSGLQTYKTWIDATADNVSNINTTRRTSEAAYQARFVVAESIPTAQGGGVRVAGAQFGDAAGRLVSDPTNPLADANGMVKKPDMDLSDQITALIVAQRAYQANVTVFERARDAYQRALEIGK
jgi:flagellar basal-body rod protein FlgC